MVQWYRISTGKTIHVSYIEDWTQLTLFLYRCLWYLHSVYNIGNMRVYSRYLNLPSVCGNIKIIVPTELHLFCLLLVQHDKITVVVYSSTSINNSFVAWCNSFSHSISIFRMKIWDILINFKLLLKYIKI